MRIMGCANLSLPKKLVPKSCPRDAEAKGLEWILETYIYNLQSR